MGPQGRASVPKRHGAAPYAAPPVPVSLGHYPRMNFNSSKTTLSKKIINSLRIPTSFLFKSPQVYTSGVPGLRVFGGPGELFLKKN